MLKCLEDHPRTNQIKSLRLVRNALAHNQGKILTELDQNLIKNKGNWHVNSDGELVITDDNIYDSLSLVKHIGMELDSE